MTHRRQSHRRHAAALRAVWISPELAGRDAGLEIGGDHASGLRENAFFGRLRRVSELTQHTLADVQHWIADTQEAQFINDAGALGWGEDFLAGGPHLRREDTHPDALDLRLRAPEGQE